MKAQATISRLARRIIGITALAASLAAIALASSSSAHALSPPAPSPDAYKGWAYASFPMSQAYATYTGTTVGVWKWSTAGWQAQRWVFGTSFYAYPFARGWLWAYRDGAWHAIRSDSFGAWNCASTSRPRVVTTKHAIHRYNSSASEVLGYVGQGSVITELCTSHFNDAATNPNLAQCMAIGCGPDKFVLVRTTPMPGCLYPAPGEPACMLAMPIGGWPTKVGYLRIPEIEFWQQA